MMNTKLMKYAKHNFNQNEKSDTFLTQRLEHKNRGRLSKMAAMLRRKQKPRDRFLLHSKNN